MTAFIFRAFATLILSIGVGVTFYWPEFYNAIILNKERIIWFIANMSLWVLWTWFMVAQIFPDADCQKGQRNTSCIYARRANILIQTSVNILFLSVLVNKM